MKKLMMCMAFVFLAACSSDVKLDATTDESMQRSLAEMQQNMSAAEYSRLENVLGRLAMADMPFEAMMRGDVSALDDYESKARARVHGKTASQIIKEAESL